MRRTSYIAAFLLAGLVLVPRSTAYADDFKLHMGATLPKWAKEVGENRFRSPWDWHGTWKWIDRTYAKANYPRIRIINRPGIKAIHLKNRKGGDWQGMNIYELSESGEVRFYVVPPKPKKTDKAKDAKK